MKKLDDVLKDFEKKAEKAESSNRKYWEDTTEDEMYNVDIHVWRKTGMGNSLQTIVGNKVSIATAITSLLRTCIDKNIFNEEEIKIILDTAINGVEDNE